MIHAQQIKNIIKNSTLFGWLYYWVGVTIVKFLQLFIKPNEKQILFISYSGRQFSDTPKEAFNLIREDPAYADYKLVWAFNRPADFKQAEITNKISSNSPLFFYHLLRSKYWVANSSIDRLIPFKHDNNVYIQFWHGVPMKALGHTEIGLAPLVQHWYDKVAFDYMFTYSDYDLDKFKEVFPRTKRFVDAGQLRKKIVERYESKTTVARIKKELGIKSDKKVLLYVPTFRGYDAKEQTTLTDATLERLAKEYVVIYRGHYFSRATQSGSIITADKFSLYKLFMVSDLLITDFSSVFFDFAPYHKPVYLFQPDLAEYQVKRGLYFTAEKLGLPVSYSEAKLMDCLHKPEYDYEALEALNDRFNPHDGEEAAYAFKSILEHT
ncbi:CDP-glycerol glycerophosphotransferase family protein [Weissella cibaria]|uniref:CDP-glycerol glycerophosphotransferase family protein n=1 Tax=Weissella cibaria TaxID=137591 RepID=UPI0021BECE04|nr:CDP-glycerol glycerophosphotransferase family protein [Weissella cibaria]MCT8400614.1 CDP-glycerol--glycerophosphate glycerophosphotransferase [Weissella cibaria]